MRVRFLVVAVQNDCCVDFVILTGWVASSTCVECFEAVTVCELTIFCPMDGDSGFALESFVSWDLSE